MSLVIYLRVFGGREFDSLIVVGKKLFPNMFTEYLINYLKFFFLFGGCPTGGL